LGLTKQEEEDEDGWNEQESTTKLVVA